MTKTYLFSYKLHLSLIPYVNTRISTPQARTSGLNHLLLSSSLSFWLKLKIFKTIIQPTLTHNALLVPYIYPSTLRKLQTFQNMIIRNCALRHYHHMKNKELRVEFQQLAVEEFIKFFDNIMHCKNPFSHRNHPQHMARLQLRRLFCWHKAILRCKEE